MKKISAILTLLTLSFFFCRSNQLNDLQKYDYVTSGALSNDCFQIIVIAAPDSEFKTMADQRENAFINAKKNITSEIEKQFLSYYLLNKSLNSRDVSNEMLNLIKEKAIYYSGYFTLEQEYYLIDNSAVLVYRIYKKNIKNEIMNI